MASRGGVVDRDSAGVAESASDATTSARVQEEVAATQEELAATENKDAPGTLEKQPIQGKIAYTIKVLEKGKPLPSAADRAMELIRQHASASEKAKERESAEQQRRRSSKGAAKRKREDAGEEEAEEELLEQFSRASLCCFIACPTCLS